MLCEKLDILFACEIRQCVGCCGKVKQTTMLCFKLPIVRIAVAVEDNALVRLYGAADKVGKCAAEILCLF